MIKPIEEIADIKPFEADLYKKEWRLKLDSNENIYQTSELVLNAIKNFNKEEISLYPTYQKTIDKLAKKYELLTDEILLTNGCDEAINLIIRTYLNKENEFISFDPSFSMPVLYAKEQGVNIKLIKYDEKFVFQENKLIENISDKTKLVYLATPDNPTGNTIKPREIENLASKFPNVLFVVDCTYINFAQYLVVEDYFDLIKRCDNIAILRSFSKDFALAGLRFGFIVSNRENIKNIKKITSPYNVNAISLACANSALNDEKRFEEIKELNIEARNLLFEGLKMLNYKPFESEGNFILCDFGEYCDFCYQKLKNYGIIVRNFPKNSTISTMLRITVPKLSGVKLILELLKKKDMLIFDADGLIFDIDNSYLCAIQETYKHFSNKTISKKEIKDLKNKGQLNCNWHVVKYLLDKENIQVEMVDIISYFQEIFFNPKQKDKKYLIDEDKLLISKEIFENLSLKYDFAIFTGRLKDEINYSLEKFGIAKYFHYLITSDDLPKNMLKPHPKGVLEILKHCPHNDIKYLANGIDDIISANGAKVETVGIINHTDDYASKINNFRHLGATYILNSINDLSDFLLK